MTQESIRKMKSKLENIEFLLHNKNEFIHLDEDDHTNENCVRIARQIEEIMPEIIIFELPRQSNHPFETLNTQKPNNKSQILINIININSLQARGNYLAIYETIKKIWFEKQHQIFLFRFDAPFELTSNCLTLPEEWQIEGIVWNYLREKYMSQFIDINDDLFKDKKNIIQCHNNHWENIKFLLQKPSKELIWNHYFIDFAKSVNVEIDSIEKMLNILKRNKRDILLKYWGLISDFNE